MFLRRRADQAARQRRVLLSGLPSMRAAAAPPGPDTPDREPVWLDVPSLRRTQPGRLLPAGIPRPVSGMRRPLGTGATVDPRSRSFAGGGPAVRGGLFVDLIPQSCWFTNVFPV